MKHDLHVPADLESIETRLRAALGAVAGTTPTVDEEEDIRTWVLPAPEPAPIRPRRWAAGVAAAAVVAVGAATFVGGGPTSMVATQDDERERTTVPLPAPGPSVDYLLPDTTPDGFRDAFVGRGASPLRATTSMEVYAAGGDPLADRALVVLRSSEPAAINSVLSFDGGSRVTIGGRTVTAASAGVLRGFDLDPVRPGVAVIGRGLDEAEVRAAAAAVLDDDRVARAVPDGFTLVYEGRHPLIEAPLDDVVFNRYATPDGLRELELRTVTGGAAPVAGIAWQLDGEREEVTLRGTRGVIATIVDPDMDPVSGSPYRLLFWTEGNVSVLVGGRRVTDDELFGFARSLRPASRAQLDELVARSEAELSED